MHPLLKTCFKCRVPQPISEFYRHSKMADGHLSKCKRCTKADVAAHRLANIDQVRKADVARGRARSIARQASNRAASKRWFADRRHRIARNAVVRAIRAGVLVPEPCEVCAEAKTQGHHDSYNHPLRVRWFCCSHHKLRHIEMREKGIQP